MRILHVYKTYFPENVTGIPRVIYELSENLADKGVESHVLALYEKGDEAPLMLGSHIVHRAQRDLHIASTSLSLDVFGKFRELVSGADVVHYHFPWPLGDLLYFAHGRKTPAIATYHSDIVKQRRLLALYKPIMHSFLGRMQKIVATSPNYVKTSPVLARFRDNVSVVPIGISKRMPPDSALFEQWRARLGENFFLFVGALRYYKGLTFLIEAARRTGLPVVIAGEGTREGWDAPDNVIFTGGISDSDREALLDLCLAFIFPSHLRSEAFGIALVEAARAGKPMISCEIGTGTSYVNANGETGLTIVPADPNALGEAMRQLACSPEMVRQMGTKAQARYEQLFRAETMAEGYLKLYRQLAGGL
jgi:rhamnosyl/mannosyltransferase